MTEHFLAALYRDAAHATRAVELLSDGDAVPLDRRCAVSRGAPDRGTELSSCSSTSLRQR